MWGAELFTHNESFATEFIEVQPNIITYFLFRIKPDGVLKYLYYIICKSIEPGEGKKSITIWILKHNGL